MWWITEVGGRSRESWEKTHQGEEEVMGGGRIRERQIVFQIIIDLKCDLIKTYDDNGVKET